MTSTFIGPVRIDELVLHLEGCGRLRKQALEVSISLPSSLIAVIRMKKRSRADRIKLGAVDDVACRWADRKPANGADDASAAGQVTVRMKVDMGSF